MNYCTDKVTKKDRYSNQTEWNHFIFVWHCVTRLNGAKSYGLTNKKKTAENPNGE